MYLHNDKDLFTDVITEANAQTGIAESIIEKDYYVTMILKLLAKSNPDIVFKGGTSLSKCFHLINRFSEDIDITFSEHIGESRRKKLKYNILKPISDELGMPIENWDSIESDKDYNYYLFGYQPANDYPVEGIMPGVKLETALVSYSFPTEERDVDSVIYGAIKDSASDIISDYGLEPFSMKVQSVSRTFIDKIYALCDYYITSGNLAMNYAKNTAFPSLSQVAEKVKNIFSGKLNRKAHHGKNGFRKISTNALESPNPTRTFCA